jgi:hypothetical protein
MADLPVNSKLMVARNFDARIIAASRAVAI